MPLHKFDESKMLKTCGLVNNGVICYLNSFLQSLMSCTSLTTFFLDNEEKFTNEDNKVAIEYIKLLKTVKDVKTYADVISPVNVAKSVIISYIKKNPDKKFGKGQEDAGEALTLFLDSIDSKDLYKFFMYKYIVKLWCLTCVEQISESVDESCIIEVPLKFGGFVIEDDSESIKEQDPLNSHIRQYMSVLDDYTCSKCKKQKCCKIYQLVCVPEIITVMFNKFTEKSNIQFPEQMEFPASNSTTLTYKMVAKIEHSGSTNGGHYWAHCFRKGELDNLDKPTPDTETPVVKKQMYNLNDSSVSAGDMKPSRESYIIFYHNA